MAAVAVNVAFVEDVVAFLLQSKKRVSEGSL